MQVLVATSSPSTRVRVSRVLRRAGLDVHVATEPLEAVRALTSAQGPKIALLGGDALHVCRDVRQADPTLRPHLIVLTQQNEPSAAEALAAGADAVLDAALPRGALLRRLRAARRCVVLQQAVEAHGARVGAELKTLASAVTLADDEPIIEIVWRALEPLRRAQPSPLGWALVSCVVPDEGRWVDVLLEGPASALDDTVATVSRRTHASLTAAGRRSLWPISRRLSSAPSWPSPPRAEGACRIAVLESPLSAHRCSVRDLHPGQVLLAPLSNVLPAGVQLTNALVLRVRPLAALDAEVEVATPSSLAARYGQPT